MSNATLLSLPLYVSTGIVKHLSARDLCILAQVCKSTAGLLIGQSSVPMTARWY